MLLLASAFAVVRSDGARADAEVESRGLVRAALGELDAEIAEGGAAGAGGFGWGSGKSACDRVNDRNAVTSASPFEEQVLQCDDCLGADASCSWCWVTNQCAEACPGMSDLASGGRHWAVGQTCSATYAASPLLERVHEVQLALSPPGAQDPVPVPSGVTLTYNDNGFVTEVTGGTMDGVKAGGTLLSKVNNAPITSADNVVGNDGGTNTVNIVALTGSDVDLMVPWMNEEFDAETQTKAYNRGVEATISATLRSAFLHAVQGGRYLGCVESRLADAFTHVVPDARESLASCAEACRDAGAVARWPPAEPHRRDTLQTRAIAAARDKGWAQRRVATKPVDGESGEQVAWADATPAARARAWASDPHREGACACLPTTGSWRDLLDASKDATECAMAAATGGAHLVYEIAGQDEYLGCHRGIPALCLGTMDGEVRMDARHGTLGHDFAHLRAAVTRARLAHGLPTVEEQLEAAFRAGPLRALNPGSGLSGSTFLVSDDSQFVFKTLRQAYGKVHEKESLKTLLKDDLAAIHADPRSYLIRAYGIAKVDFGVKGWKSAEKRYMIMEDATGGLWIPQSPEEALKRGVQYEPWMRECQFDFYDVKGPGIRPKNKPSKKHGKQDTEFLNEVRVLPLTAAECAAVQQQADRDLGFLAKHSLIDYSYVIAIRKGPLCRAPPRCDHVNRCFASKTGRVGDPDAKPDTWVSIGVIDYLNVLNAYKQSDSYIVQTGKDTWGKFTNYKQKMMQSLAAFCPSGGNDEP